AAARGFPPDRIAYIPNGIDVDAMRPDLLTGRSVRQQWGISEQHFLIGKVARFDHMKDHANFIAAAALFARDHADARFVCVGDGPVDYRVKMQALARSKGLDDRIVWAGERTDMRAIYNALDLVTLSSAFGEGFPNAVAEAMACGVPVVATDVGDVASIVGECGLVVPPKEPELLAEGWLRMRERLAQAEGMRN